MLFSEENVRSNIRFRDGKRVIFLDKEDTLTPSARDFLYRERITILPAQQAKIEEYVLENGAVFLEKPENYTHLRGNILVPKTHPVIQFRGKMDTLQANLLLAQAVCSQKEAIGEILQAARNIIRWDVTQGPAVLDTLLSLTEKQLREHSHNPKKYYGIPHFMPSHTDGEAILRLNMARCAAREAELSALQAFDGIRDDLPLVLNRLSSAIYILMIRAKKEGREYPYKE